MSVLKNIPARHFPIHEIENFIEGGKKASATGDEIHDFLLSKTWGRAARYLFALKSAEKQLDAKMPNKFGDVKLVPAEDWLNQCNIMCRFSIMNPTQSSPRRAPTAVPQTPLAPKTR